LRSEAVFWGDDGLVLIQQSVKRPAARDVRPVYGRPLPVEMAGTAAGLGQELATAAGRRLIHLGVSGA